MPKTPLHIFSFPNSDACWAFSYITDGTNEKIQWVIETGVVARFVQLLHLSEGENAALITPCLRCVSLITLYYLTIYWLLRFQ